LRRAERRLDAAESSRDADARLRQEQTRLGLDDHAQLRRAGQQRDPDHDALTSASLRVPLKRYADEAANLISYIQQRDWTGLAWLVPRFVNEPIAYVMPLSWVPELEPLMRPALALTPSDEVQPGLYSLTSRSFLHAYRSQPNIARQRQRGRTPIIPDEQLDALALIFNTAQRTAASRQVVYEGDCGSSSLFSVMRLG
jgi:hypothetical protein